MLLFMREQGLGEGTPGAGAPVLRNSQNDVPINDSAAPGSPLEGCRCATGPTNPLPTGPSGTQHRAGDQSREYLTVATKGKNVRKSTMLLAVLFGIGLLCLWFMIKKSAPPTAQAATVSPEETQIEMAIMKLTGVRSEMFNRMDEIVKKFYEFSDVQQIRVNELVKNPFEREIFLGSLRGLPDTKGTDPLFDAEILRQLRMRHQAEMQLLSIMKSDAGSCCMINDKILYEGDSIRGFMVCQISDSFVKLEHRSFEGGPENNEGLTQIVLKLSE